MHGEGASGSIDLQHRSHLLLKDLTPAEHSQGLFSVHQGYKLWQLPCEVGSNVKTEISVPKVCEQNGGEGYRERCLVTFNPSPLRTLSLACAHLSSISTTGRDISAFSMSASIFSFPGDILTCSHSLTGGESLLVVAVNL
ncbi:hypothetical protein AV530_004819 [Patagioenas fasciata monilis]|uniref:Uncharacterized protein n=1 Tax=Patagioenas fasciata monilis TaxID=372326 RepID=A0A1V4KEA8_PATFA|nr:hypothetical protein AV530_004819 [Patagioenas fasciata monilis]